MKFFVALLCLVAVQSAPLPAANLAVFPFAAPHQAVAHPAFSAPWPIQDTPEVAAAKAEHLAVLNAARVSAGAAPIVPFPFIQLPVHEPILLDVPTPQMATPHIAVIQAPKVNAGASRKSFATNAKTSTKSTFKKPFLRFVPDRKL